MMKVKVKDLKSGTICVISEPTLPDERVEVDQDAAPCNCRGEEGLRMDAFDLYVTDEIRPRHFKPDFEVTVLS